MNRMTRKTISGLTALTLLFAGTPAIVPETMQELSLTASAASYTEGTLDGLTYRKYEDYVKIYKADSSISNAAIPAEIEGLPVTAISDSAFENCKSLKSVSIPDSVTFVGQSAFYGCISLNDVQLSASMKHINRETFKGCINLTNISIPASAESWIMLHSPAVQVWRAWSWAAA